VFENVNITQALLIFVYATVNLTIVILTFPKIYQSVYNNTYTSGRDTSHFHQTNHDFCIVSARTLTLFGVSRWGHPQSVYLTHAFWAQELGLKQFGLEASG
jgi:hypothetical protein